MLNPQCSRRLGLWLALVLSLLPALVGAQAPPLAQRPGGLPVEPSAYALAAAEFLPDLDVLRTGSPRLRLQLPEGGELTVESTGVDVRPNGDVVWRGRVAGEPVSSFVLSVRSGFATGSLTAARGVYRIQIRSGRSIFERMDPNRPRPERDTRPGVAPPAEAAVAGRAMSGAAAAVDAAAADPAVGPAEIDVLVVHTEVARAFAGGQGPLVATVDAMIDYANGVFVNSGVDARYRLAHVVHAPFAQEQDDGNNVTSLNVVYQLNVLRLTYGADVVAVLVKDMVGRACGVAPSNPVAAGIAFQWFAFELELDTPCNPIDVFAHEGGHVLGLNHDPATQAANGDAPSAVPYAQGHVVPGVFGTIMSYAEPPIPFFSSPILTFDGIPIGIADERDNARAAREHAPIVAGYLPPGPPAPTGPPEAPTGLNPVATTTAEGVLIVSMVWFSQPWATYDVERSVDGVTFAPLGTTTTNSFVDAAVTSPNTYHYRVRAHNFRGSSPFGEPRSVVMPLMPGAPSGLTATVQGATDVLLRWTDGSTNEVGFLVEVLQYGVFEPMLDAPANATQVLFPIGQPSTAYTFRVRAFTDQLWSPPSNEITVTTLPANPGVVTGVAFHDANRNGRADIGEVPAANLVVYLDINGNGLLDELTPPLVAPQVTVSSAVRNAPGTNLPYVGTANYTLRNLPFGTRHICASFTPQTAGTSFCRTVTIQSSGTTTGVNFPVVEGKVGVSTMTPSAQTVKAGDLVFVDVQWTHTGGRWVALKDAVIRLSDDRWTQGIQIRFDEATRTFSVYHPLINRWSQPLAAGSSEVVHTLDGALVLRDTQVIGTGPTGPSVTLRLALRFSPLARGRTYEASILLQDDAGYLQGYDALGSITVKR